MKLKKVGFFRELPHGMPDAPLVATLISEAAQNNEGKIIEYLNNGILFIATTGFVEDVLMPGRFICCPHILTDGIWAWPADFAYYVEKYHVKLPIEFVECMQKNNWSVPDKGKICIDQLKF